MVCTMENKTENIVIGTLLNDTPFDGFYQRESMLLKDEMFSDKKNAFIFRIIQRMHNDGLTKTTPCDLYLYTTTNNIRVGNVGNFCSYMMDLARQHYEYETLDAHVKDLVLNFIKMKRNDGQR